MVALVDIGNGHQLAPAAAASFMRAVAAGCPNTVTSSYRDPATQAAMRANYLAELAKFTTGRRPTKPTYVAAVDDSEHVTGEAVDLKPPAEAWMRAHPDYGFVFTDPTEKWHAAYRLPRDKHLTDGTTPPVPITPTTEEEDDVFILGNKDQAGRVALIYPDGTWSLIYSGAAASNLKAAGVKAADVDASTWADACAPGRKRV